MKSLGQAGAVRGTRRRARKKARPTPRSWAARLARAEKRGRFTVEDIALAGSFRTCKVSEYPGFYDGKAIKRRFVDTRVYELGLEFASAVRNNVPRAAEIATQIDAFARKHLGRARSTAKARSPQRASVSK